MLEKKDVQKISAREGVPQAMVEKDYALSVALIKIALSPLSQKLIFKGGTAIRKIYFKNARFSEDLDFSLKITATKSSLVSLFQKTFRETESNGVQFSEVIEENTRAGLKLKVKFVGPLQYWQSIRIDCNFRENTVQTPINAKIIDEYYLGEYYVQTMPIEEIFAEKIHALSSRAAPRDLYDIQFLLKNKVQMNRLLVEKKLAYYNEKYDEKRFEKNIEEMKTNWERDLGKLLNKLPDYDEVSKYIKKELKK